MRPCERSAPSLLQQCAVSPARSCIPAGNRVRRNARPPQAFPGLVAAVARLPARTLVLDGEVAVFDQDLRARFEWLREPEPEAVATPPLFMAFDLLCRSDFDLSRLSLRERRARLEDLVRGSPLILPVRRLAPKGLEAWAAVLAS